MMPSSSSLKARFQLRAQRLLGVPTGEPDRTAPSGRPAPLVQPTLSTQPTQPAPPADHAPLIKPAIPASLATGSTPPPSLGTPSPLATQVEPLQEKIWNQAYDDLKAKEPKLVEAFEAIVSAELSYDQTSAEIVNRAGNELMTDQKVRSHQMQQLVQNGLKQTKREAAIKQGIDEGLQAVHAIRGLMDKAVHAAPEAAVVWATVCLGIDILSNPITEAVENRTGIQHILSRIEWYWNLAGLLLDENRGATSTAALRYELERHVVQLFQKLLSYQIRSVCLYHRNQAIIVSRDMFKIDDWAGQLSSIKEAEAAVQRDMEQYNTEESKIQLQKLNKSTGDILAELQGQAQRQEARHRDEKDEQCLKDLYETDPRDDKTRIEKDKGGLLKDAYHWILDHEDYQYWIDSPQGQILWIKGDPGKGKTMLLCGVINELKAKTDTCLSYFFCQATNKQLSNATAVVRGLVFLLAVQEPSLVSHIRERYDHAGKQLFEGKNAWEALSTIFTAMLDDPRSRNTILAVDALDECDTGREELLELITKPSSVKWIISCRNWPDIERKLSKAEQKIKLQLELNPQLISNAVNSYIRYKVHELATDKSWDEETRLAIVDHLTANADGTFLWVALVYQALADPEVEEWHAHDKLNEFPRGLIPLYRRMMQQISQSNDAARCQKMLAMASIVYRPVTLEELKALVEPVEHFSLSNLEKLIARCGSFLTLRGGIISFVHQSAKDFLLEEALDDIFPAGLAYQHRVAFSRSLGLLGGTLKRDIYHLQAPGLLIDQVSRPQPDPLGSIQYSCIFWANHLYDTKGGDEFDENDAILAFMQEHYLQWLEALSLLHSIPAGVRAIERLEDSIEIGSLRDIVKDAHRFLLSQKGSIEIAPLQVYVSALLFSPTNSWTRRRYSHEEPGWIDLKPEVEADWNACLQTLSGHYDPVTSVVFSPDGQRLASGSNDLTVKIWDAASGACLQTLSGHGDWVRSVVFSSDGQRLASGSDDRTVKIWDAASGACLQTLPGHNSCVRSVVYSPDKQRLASGSDDGTVKIWDATSGACLQNLSGHDDWVRSVVFSPDGQRLASGSNDLTVKIWDATSGACLQTLSDHDGCVRSVAYSPGNQRLASGSDDGTVKIWDAASGACLQTLSGHDGCVTSVVFSYDGRRLASGSDDKMVKIWDAASGACLQTLSGHDDWVRSVVFSCDGRLASGSDDRTVRIWDAASGACPQTFSGHDDWVRSVVLSPDGERLASGSDDRTVKIWDAASGACLQTLSGHNGWVRSVVFSHDGRLASGSYDRTVKIWDAASGASLQTLLGHDNAVASVVFSPDGQWLASGSYDEMVKIWDTTLGVCLQTISVGNTVYRCSFDPSNKSRLFTNIGVLNLDMPNFKALPTDVMSLYCSFEGYGVGKGGLWIMKGEERILWLPPEYRPVDSAVSGTKVVLGCKSGRVLIIGFRSMPSC